MEQGIICLVDTGRYKKVGKERKSISGRYQTPRGSGEG
jgi:hypothetical protein